jgi:hypothetical protein
MRRGLAALQSVISPASVNPQQHAQVGQHVVQRLAHLVEPQRRDRTRELSAGRPTAPVRT